MEGSTETNADKHEQCLQDEDFPTSKRQRSSLLVVKTADEEPDAPKNGSTNFHDCRSCNTETGKVSGESSTVSS